MPRLVESKSNSNVKVPLGVYLGGDIDLLTRIVKAIRCIAEIDGNYLASENSDEIGYGRPYGCKPHHINAKDKRLVLRVQPLFNEIRIPLGIQPEVTITW